MKAGKITAKIRDAVQVSFMENGDKRARYKNIEIPDALKELEISDLSDMSDKRTYPTCSVILPIFYEHNKSEGL